MRAASMSVEETSEQGEDHEGEREDGETQTGVLDADYDDGFEYEEWGGIMLRKCLTKALLQQVFIVAVRWFAAALVVVVASAAAFCCSLWL